MATLTASSSSLSKTRTKPQRKTQNPPLNQLTTPSQPMKRSQLTKRNPLMQNLTRQSPRLMTPKLMHLPLTQQTRTNRKQSKK